MASLVKDKRIFAISLDPDSLAALRGIWEMYNEPDEALIVRLLSETKQNSLLGRFWVKKIA